MAFREVLLTCNLFVLVFYYYNQSLFKYQNNKQWISNVYNFKLNRIVYKLKAKYMCKIENYLQLWII